MRYVRPIDREQAAPDSPYVQGDDAWTAFSATCIDIHVGSSTIWVQPNSTPAPLPWESPVHVITGWNPGQLQTDEANHAANVALEAALRLSRAQVYPAEGRATNGTWAEDSFAVVGLSRSDAISLGRQFGQLAIFEITAQGIEVLSCA